MKGQVAVAFLDEKTGRPVSLSDEILRAWPEFNIAWPAIQGARTPIGYCAPEPRIENVAQRTPDPRES